MNTQISMDKKRFILLAISILVLVIGYFLPTPEGLSEGGKMTLVLLVFMFIMWVGEVMPTWVTSIAVMLVLPFLGMAENMTQVYSDFISPTFFFLLAVFGIAGMVQNSELPSRIMVFFIRSFGNNSKKILFAFGATAWVLSAFMNDLAACAIVSGIAGALLKEMEFPEGFRKSLMVFVPFGAMLGGIVMPISSGTNATIMQILVTVKGESVSFLQWTLCGIPIALIGLILAYLLVLFIFRPEPLSEECMQTMLSEFKVEGKMSAHDKKAVTLIIVMLILWMSGTWIPVLDANFVALVGMVVMFLPGVNLITWPEYREAVPWDLLLFIGALFSFCKAMVRCGTTDWIIAATLGSNTAWNAVLFFMVMSLILIVMRSILPAGALLVAMATPGVLAMGTAFGVDSMTLLITLSVWGQVNLLLPIFDPMWLMTYNYGHFKTLDLVKVGIPLGILITLVLVFVMPWISGLTAAL